MEKRLARYGTIAGMILALFGAILCLVYGVLYIMGTPVPLSFHQFQIQIAGIMGAIMYSMVLVSLSLIVLANYGIIDTTPRASDRGTKSRYKTLDTGMEDSLDRNSGFVHFP